MISQAVVTRFAPSPTGHMHLGNARTALFNALLARAAPGGRFLLRIEDTDAARSTPAHAAQLLADLRWLGLNWDGEPLHQSQRGEVYARLLGQLEREGRAYACFCTPRELELARAAQLAAGKPPRYSGRCRELPAAEVAARLASGESSTLRFRVPQAGAVVFDDIVHGPREFACAGIGDFVLRRADASAAFFFSNAVDDAHGGVTQVLRGDDHLANTPRQLLILQALSLPAPRYGHLALLTGADGAPLSKREGAVSVAMLREEGWRPEAIVNHLFRLGHSSPLEGLADFDTLAKAFDTTHLQRSPAHFDPAQLRAWQKLAVHRLSPQEADAWLGPRLPASLSGGRRHSFVAAVLPNLVLPDDVLPWLAVIEGELPALSPEAAEVVAGADRRLFAAAAAHAAGNDFPRISAAAREATGLKGAALFKPLRAALTGRLDGPELGPLLQAMPEGLPARRLARFA